MKRALAILALLLIGATANAQQPENPIPSSGGAIIMHKALPDPLAAGWEGEKVCELLQETDEMRALRCTFPPGVGHERHYHAPHFGYILEGSKMRITDAGGSQTRDLNAGASWWSDGTAWHEVLNVGETTGVYIIVEPKSATQKGTLQ
ncbi:MAG: hypothetical protein DHS20C05_24890 [Hyphococcus sp.]|nr:MAG: hypothetical protein DHS20C05_24890 [Marinicaulis sp.]